MHVYTLHRSNELDHEYGHPAILLKYKFNKSLIWYGTTKLDLKTQEKPLTIFINNRKTYFYSSGIEKIKTKFLKIAWVDFKTYNAYKLSNNEQQQLISKFISFTLVKDPYLKIQELEKQIELLQDSKSKNHSH